ncbi:MAG: aminotransferase class V-fold PLP-dependent enzyme [Bacteroidetes bacterium]|nr:aminotransferase class V-fold PLP-dependent enzyme [Bacteroidota bacterium]
MLSCQKSEFSLSPDIHYLNCAYMSPVSKKVEMAGIEAIRGKRSPADILPDDFFRLPTRVKKLFACLVHAPDPQQVALFPSVSYGIASVARNVATRPGQNLVVLHEQFPSNVYTWMRLAEERGCTLRTVAAPAAHSARSTSAAWNEAILEAIDEGTAAVAVPIVHWADGTLFDMAAIRKRTDLVGAALVIDGTQSVGALPLSVADIRPDALIVAGYKWLFGPYSCAMGWIGPRFLDGVPLEENWINRLGSEHFAGLVDYEPSYQPGATRFDVGEKSNFILLPMLAAALEQILEWRPEGIQAYCEQLLHPFQDRIRQAGFDLADPVDRGHHLFGLRMPEGRSTEAVRKALWERHVSVSVRGTAIRIAPHVYNDVADVAALVDALEATQRK